MPFSCVVSTPAAEVIDAAGGTTPGSTTTATVACRVGVPSGNDQKVAERLGLVVDAMITMPYGTSAPERGTIEVTTTGKTYEIVRDNSEQSYQTAVRVMARQVR